MLSEAIKDITFILQLLRMMRIKVKFPLVVCVKNTGDIFMRKNVITSLQTKHVDICTKYVCECMEYRIIQIILVKLVDNTSDIITKNI